MATISESFSGNVDFTAPFDCIVGIYIESGYYSSKYFVVKHYKNSPTSGTLNLGGSLTGTKISNIIMAAGDRITCAGILIHITGVSA